MPRNFIIDTFHGEWVAVGAENGIQESNTDWRTNPSSALATFLLPSQINDGVFRWSDRYDQWIFHANYNSYINQDQSERLEWQRDQRQHFGDNYVWNVLIKNGKNMDRILKLDGEPIMNLFLLITMYGMII